MNDQTKPTLKLELKFTALASLAEVDVRIIKSHDIANEDPLMNGAEFEALKVSIKASGIREPITLFRDNGVMQILDGRNRYNAAQEIGYRWRVEDFRVFNGSVEEARKLASELNDIRRHLSADQRKEKAAKLVAANPSLSSRALAAMCGVSHTTIVKMREQVSDEDKRYTSFVRGWGSLSLAHQERFVREHRIDLAEFLRSTV